MTSVNHPQLSPKELARARRTVEAKINRIRRNRRYGWMGGTTLVAIAAVAALLVTFAGHGPKKVTVTGHPTTTTTAPPLPPSSGSGPPPTAPPTTFGGFPQTFQLAPAPVLPPPPPPPVALPPPAPAPAPPPAPLTSVIRFNPYSAGISAHDQGCQQQSAPPQTASPSSGTLLPGLTTTTTAPPTGSQGPACTCDHPSAVAGGASRCAVGSQWFDPCWLSGTQFLCVSSPTSGTARGQFTGGPVTAGSMNAPWAIKLQSGQVCTTGAILPPPGNGSPYVCPGGGSAGALVKSNTSAWTAAVRPSAGAAPVTTPLATVWF